MVRPTLALLCAKAGAGKGTIVRPLADRADHAAAVRICVAVLHVAGETRP